VVRSVKRKEKGTQFPPRRITIGAPNPSFHFGHRMTAGDTKKYQQYHKYSTFFNTVHLLPNDIRFGHGDLKLASCPGRHLASLRPWVWWVL